MVVPILDFSLIIPEIVVVLTALVVLLVAVFSVRENATLPIILTLIGLVIAIIATVVGWKGDATGFNGMVVDDQFSRFIRLILLGVTALIVLLAHRDLEDKHRVGEYLALLLFAVFGMMIMVLGGDLLMIFLGLETMSICLYILAGFQRKVRSNESSFKYFILGAFSTGFLLYGIALTFGVTGSTQLALIHKSFAENPASMGVLAYAGLGLIMIGFGFKIAAVPFHFWSPDVYDGAPTSVTAFMATATKAAAFAAFLRILTGAFFDLHMDWSQILWVLAVVTMTVGNVVAIAQTNIKRMLAYSAIAHAGYLLVGLVAVDAQGASAIMYYLMVYVLMNIGAFSVAILINHRGKGWYELDDYRGAAYRNPFLAAMMAIFMLALAGIPPTGGFMAKFYIFGAAVKTGHITLVVIAVLNSAISVFYYIRVLVLMYMQPEGEYNPIPRSPLYSLVLVICAVGILGFGLFPGAFITLANQSLPML
jgi:NADH-quinone oxidoreductase subunit N